MYGILRLLKRASVFAACALVAGCCGMPGQPPCNNPHITVSSLASALSISGTDFAGAVPCAHLSITGLPAGTNPVKIGDVTCSGGAFNNFVWNYSFFNCTPTTSMTVSVIASDASTLKAAIQTVSFPWGPGCGLVNHTACGGEGEIPCPGGTCSAGPPDLHPDFSGGLVLCTKQCGHTKGYTPCTAGMDGCPAAPGTSSTLIAPQRACVTKQSGLNVFSCFDHSMLSNTPDCLCTPNTINSCATNTSLPSPPKPLSGACVREAFSGC